MLDLHLIDSEVTVQTSHKGVTVDREHEHPTDTPEDPRKAVMILNNHAGR